MSVKSKLKSIKAVYFPCTLAVGFFIKAKSFLAMLKSRRRLEKICKEHPGWCVILLFGRGIGDNCLSMAYLKAFREKIGKKILLLAPNHMEDLFNRYSTYDKIICFDKSVLSKLQTAFNKRFYWNLCDKPENEVSLMHVNVYSYLNADILNLRSLSWLNVLRDVIYKLPQNAEIQFPAVKKVDVPAGKKRVLVNPFSNSSKIPVEAMTEIIGFFREKGYEIFTNCVASDSFCYENTMRYCKSFMELYDEADQFEYVVSVRSGILDLLASKKPRQIVLRVNKGWENLYSVKMWGCVDALEIDWDDPEKMSRIKNFVGEKA